jgi:hypothetical protein
MADADLQQLQVPQALPGSHNLDLGQNERSGGDLAQRALGVALEHSCRRYTEIQPLQDILVP